MALSSGGSSLQVGASAPLCQPHPSARAASLIGSLHNKNHAPRSAARSANREDTMANKILTTHVGSLPRPQKLLDVAQKRTLGQQFDQAAFDREMKSGVADVVKHQKDIGIDLVNDGELGHTMGWAYDYGAWWSYVVKRLGGVEAQNVSLWATHLTAHTKAAMAPKDFVVGDWTSRRDMAKFQEAYMDPNSGCGLPEQFMTNNS